MPSEAPIYVKLLDIGHNPVEVQLQSGAVLVKGGPAVEIKPTDTYTLGMYSVEETEAPTSVDTPQESGPVEESVSEQQTFSPVNPNLTGQPGQQVSN